MISGTLFLCVVVVCRHMAITWTGEKQRKFSGFLRLSPEFSQPAPITHAPIR